MLIMMNVALDPISFCGLDSIVKGRKINNDATAEVLTEMSISHSETGANFVTPSDILNCRILEIRKKNRGFSLRLG
jgi:porphobilinogen synthase